MDLHETCALQTNQYRGEDKSNSIHNFNPSTEFKLFCIRIEVYFIHLQLVTLTLMRPLRLVYIFIAILFLTSCEERENLVFIKHSDLNGHTIGMVIGTTHVDYITNDYPDSEQATFDGITDLVHALKVGSIEAAAIEGVSWKAMQSEHPELVTFWDYWRKEPFGMIFNKSNTELLNHYNNFLSELTESGELEKIENKWLESPNSAQMPDLSGIPREGDPLVVACTGTSDFYDFIKDGVNAGLDIEIVERFAAYLGRPIEFFMLNFGGMIAAVSSNVVDMATSAICITEERAKQVNFGNTYTNGYSVIISRKENTIWAKHNQVHLKAGNKEKIVKKANLWDVLEDSFQNNLIEEKRWKLIVEGLITTLYISILSIISGTALAFGICAMRMSRSRIYSGIARGYIKIIQGIPLLVLLMFLFYVVLAQYGISALTVSVISFSLNFSAFAAEIFRSGLESIDPGQAKAGIANGFTKLQTFRYIILPQAVNRIIPTFKGEIASLVRNTSIVGYIAVADLTASSDIIRSRTHYALFPLIVITILYFAIVWLLSKGIDLIGKRSE